jgi:hypothetical protein
MQLLMSGGGAHTMGEYILTQPVAAGLEPTAGGGGAYLLINTYLNQFQL